MSLAPIRLDLQPRTPPPSVIFKEAAASNKPLTGCRILLVEDEMLVLMHTEDMLEDLGCTAVVSAATVADGLACLDTGTFDAALIDLNLNGDRSYAVADLLADRGVPFAFATGYGAHGLREQDGARPVLVKPYPVHELVRTMIALLAR